MFHRLVYFSFSISSACNCAELTELSVKLGNPCLVLSALISSKAYFTNSSRVGGVGVGLGVGVGAIVGVGVADGGVAVDVGVGVDVGVIVGLSVTVGGVGVASGLIVGVGLSLLLLLLLNRLLLKTIMMPATRSAIIRIIAKIFVRKLFDDELE
jgi:hypothetical protein